VRAANRDRVESPRNWGATADETARHYPCDDLGFAASDVFFRAIAVAADAELAYRWLCQLRVAPYSYDLLDNFARPSPPRLVAGAERLETGQRLMTIFRLVSFERPRRLTLALDSRLGRTLMGDLAGTYAVETVPGGVRIVAKILVRYPRGLYGRLLGRVMPWMDLVMFRKQMFTLKRYIERDATASRTPPTRDPLR